MPRNEYSHATASKIRACFKANPGLRAKDIAKLVGLRRETVNSYLYSRQSGALGHEVMQDDNYGWHLKETLNNVTRTSKHPPFSTNVKQSNQHLSRKYSIKTVQKIFCRDDYNTLNDTDQEKLAQMLEEVEREQTEKQLSQKQDRPFMLLRSGWFWVALLLGVTLSLGTILLIQDGRLPSTPPVESNPELSKTI